MKKKIIFIQSFKFLDFHYDLYEVEKFKKFFSVECHDLTLIKNKKIENHYQYLRNRFSITKFKDLEEWRNKIFSILEKYNENLFICFMHYPTTFFELNIYYSLIKRKSNVCFFDFDTIPVLKLHKNKTIPENLFYKIVRFTTRPKQIINLKKVSLVNFLMNNFNKNFNPKYIFVNTKKKYLINRKRWKKTKVYRIHSWDGSKCINYQKKKMLKSKKVATYLSAFSTNSASDSANYNTLRRENSLKVLNSIDKFFNHLEKKFKLDIKIAKHPREEDNFNSPIYKSNKRFNSKNLTRDLVSNSNVVITTMSSAISYAALFAKPLLFIITNEHYKNISLISYTKALAEHLKSDLVNIDLNKNYKLNLKLNNITKKKYKLFIKNYLISDQFKQKSNNQILTKLFI